MISSGPPPSRITIPGSPAYTKDHYPHSRPRTPGRKRSTVSGHDESNANLHFDHASAPISPGGYRSGGSYRTKPCVNYQKGRCQYGDSCTFAHVNTTLNMNYLPPSPISPPPNQWIPPSPIHLGAPAAPWQQPPPADGYSRHRRGSSLSSIYSPNGDALGLPHPHGMHVPITPISPADAVPDPLSAAMGKLAIVPVPVFMNAPPVLPMFEQAKLDKMEKSQRSRSGSVGSSKPRLCKYARDAADCPKGKACPFAHEKDAVVSAPPPKPKSPPTPAQDGDQPTWRVLGGGVLIGEAGGKRPKPNLRVISENTPLESEPPTPPPSYSATSREDPGSKPYGHGQYRGAPPPQSAPPFKTRFDIHPAEVAKSNPTTPIKNTFPHRAHDL